MRRNIIGVPTIYFDNIDSTNDYAISLLSKSNPNEGTVIWASYQSQGRGQIGSNWCSDQGDNLLMSVIIHPRFLLASQQFALNIVASLAIREALISYGIEAKIKWPNDIYIGDRKICGLLVQNILTGKTIKSSVIGIGLNVNQQEFSPDIPNPTSLLRELDRVFDIGTVKAEVCAQLQYQYHALQDEGYDHLKKVYMKHLYRLGRSHKYMIDGSPMEAQIIDIDEQGKLLLEIDGALRSFHFREMKFIMD